MTTERRCRWRRRFSRDALSPASETHTEIRVVGLSRYSARDDILELQRFEQNKG